MRKHEVTKKVCSVFIAAAMLLSANAVSASAADSEGWVKSKYTKSFTVSYKELGGDFKDPGYYQLGVLHFTKKGTVGCGLDYTEAENCFRIGNNTAYTEMYVGFKAKIKNNKVVITNYDHLSSVDAKLLDKSFKIERTDGTVVTTGIEQSYNTTITISGNKQTSDKDKTTTASGNKKSSDKDKTTTTKSGNTQSSDEEKKPIIVLDGEPIIFGYSPSSEKSNAAARLTDKKQTSDKDKTTTKTTNNNLTIDGDTIKIDLNQDIFKKQGIFAIICSYNVQRSDKKTQTFKCNLYLYIDSDKNHTPYICYGRDDIPSDKNGKDQLKRQKIEEPHVRFIDVNRTIKNAKIKPEDCLNPNICYPTSAHNEDYYDTKYWQKVSDDVIKEHGAEKESNAFKATLVHDWMTRNLSYDEWKAKNLVYPRYKNDYGAPGKYYVSQTKCGVCYDFANIFAIMCRQQNVPCVMLTNPNHAWNAVYLNGEWLEIDMTNDVEKKCNTKDFSDIPKKTYQNSYCYESFCNFDYRYTGWNDIEVMDADYF